MREQLTQTEARQGDRKKVNLRVLIVSITCLAAAGLLLAAIFGG